nr:hypothetical protein [Nocardioides convexus]
MVTVIRPRLRGSATSPLPLSCEGAAPREHPPGRRRDPRGPRLRGRVCGPAPSPRRSLVAALPGVHLLGIRSNTNVTARVLAEASDLVAVGCFCIGTNQVDLAEAAARGIAVFNAPYSNTRSVVESRHRRDHQPGPATAGEDPADARRDLGQVRAGQPRGARADRRHRRLRQHRHPGSRPWPRRSA